MLYALMRNWWAVVLRGVGAVLFGVVMAAWPGMTVPLMVLLFAVHATVDGGLLLYCWWRC